MSPSGRERQLPPREFPTKKKAEAEFWAWLTEGYTILTDSVASSGETKSERKIIVLPKDEIKSAIQDAMKKNNLTLAQDLLEVASRPSEGSSDDMVRKSLRVGSGEYVKLLYVKILERTSFADVIMEVLLKPCKRVVENLKSQFYGCSYSVAKRLDHLLTTVEAWETEKPESRARMAELGEWNRRRILGVSQPETVTSANEWDMHEAPVADGTKPFAWLSPYCPRDLLEKERLEKMKTAFSRFVLSDLMLKASGGDYVKPVSGLFDEFKESWKKQIDREFPEQVGVRATVENQGLLFTISFMVAASFNVKKEQEFFDKYGEEEVKDFVNRILLGGVPLSKNMRYEGITNSEEYKHLVDSHSVVDPTYFNIYVGTELLVPCCRVTVKEPENFELDLISDTPSLTEKDKKQGEYLLRKIAEKIGRSEWIKEKLTDIHISSLAKMLMPEAIEKASGPNDYKEINSLMMIANKLNGYHTIMNFSEELVESTLRHHSVVSFYVNADLWRLIPLVLEDKNWMTLIDEYLKEKDSLD
jgi:hypothetical protein